MDKLCLLIDDNKQDTNCEKIKRIGKSQYAMNIETIQFNVGHSELTEVLDEFGNINIPKVIQYYKENFRKYHFDLIAFDWDFNDPAVDGISLINHFVANNLFKKSKVVLYSGVLEQNVQGYFEEYRKDQSTFANNWKKMKTLIEIPITGFFDRTNYEDKIAEAIHNKRKQIDIEDYFLKKLTENGDLIFNDINPRFEGRTFAQLADQIRQHPIEGNNFISELIDQTLAYLTKFNSEKREG